MSILARFGLPSSPLDKLDPSGMVQALSKAALGVAANPHRCAGPVGSALQQVARDTTAAAGRSVGLAVGEDMPAGTTGLDRRFADTAWTENAFYWWLRRSYLTCGVLSEDLLERAGLDAVTKRKAEFARQAIIDAMAPTNFGPLNPAVRKRAFETGMLSLARGAKQCADDLVHNGGRPRQVARDTHRVGENLAVTPGKVVYRNDLMELIQYSPATAQVHAVPLLCSPPWINKYYVMDLSPGRSLVEWAVEHGHTVFMISYRNPDDTMRDISMDDYLLQGPVQALDVIGDITGATEVNLLSLCLGGTLAMATLAYLDASRSEHPNRPSARSSTFLNTLLDFTDPGALGVFTDSDSVDRLARAMADDGFLPASTMSDTFNFLRGNDLIWNYVVSGWWMGEEPRGFDLLSWNDDSTRMPANMHAFYLRRCYVENALAQGEMVLGGQRLDPGTVSQDLYFLSAEQDHIAPWRSAYTGARLARGDVRFVLSNSGHIAGVVNPPGPKSKSKHFVREGALPVEADTWLESATEVEGTWWEDWAGWISDRGGEMRKPPRTGSRRHRVLADAPGTYVFDRS